MKKIIYTKPIEQVPNTEKHYKVVKLSNTFTPEIGTLISESELNNLISNDSQIEIISDEMERLELARESLQADGLRMNALLNKIVVKYARMDNILTRLDNYLIQQSVGVKI